MTSEYLTKLRLALAAEFFPTLPPDSPSPEGLYQVQLDTYPPIGTTEASAGLISGITLKTSYLEAFISQQTAPEWGYVHLRDPIRGDKNRDPFLNKDGSFDTEYGENLDRYFDLRDDAVRLQLVKLLRQLFKQDKETVEQIRSLAKTWYETLPQGGIPKDTEVGAA